MRREFLKGTVMKIAFTSDLHVNSSSENHDIIPAIRKKLDDNPPDVFIIAGDISSNLTDIETTLGMFRGLPSVKFFVPGNHDIWVEDEYTSDIKYFDNLPKICREAGFHPLWLQPYTIGDTGFCGTMGWYDLSLRSTLVNFTDADYAKKRFFLFTWMDKVRMRFYRDSRVLDNAELTELLLERFIADCEDVSPKTNRIISVFHHLPFRNPIVYNGKPQWDYFAAFFGSARFGEYILSNPKIARVICGHYHRRKSLDIAPGLVLHLSPFGYYEREGDRPFSRWISKRLSYINI